jgi:hypothetical protein
MFPPESYGLLNMIKSFKLPLKAAPSDVIRYSPINYKSASGDGLHQSPHYRHQTIPSTKLYMAKPIKCHYWKTPI